MISREYCVLSLVFRVDGNLEGCQPFCILSFVNFILPDSYLRICCEDMFVLYDSENFLLAAASSHVWSNLKNIVIMSLAF